MSLMEQIPMFVTVLSFAVNDKNQRLYCTFINKSLRGGNLHKHVCTHMRKCKTHTHLLVCIFTKGMIFLQFLDFGITLHFLQLQLLSCCFLLLQLLFQVLNMDTKLAKPQISANLMEMHIRNQYYKKFNTLRAQQA